MQRASGIAVRTMLATVLKGLRSGSSPVRSFGVPALTSAACRWQHAEAIESSESDLQEFRETVRDFAQRIIAPHAAEIDQQNSFPRSVNLWQDIGEFGLHGTQRSLNLLHGSLVYHKAGASMTLDAGLTAPADYGGLDVGYQHHCVAMEVSHSAQSLASGLSKSSTADLC